jgi:phosphatidylserine/phosphatidylglycerophosphate/cardiolipin synthase-like enzyme
LKNSREKYRERQIILSKIYFLTNEDYWKTIPEIIKASKHTDVAVAYLGSDGAKLLPLKKGDRLVVDMSPATVKSGTTNPFEIEKLIKRGVKVFARRNLHAKVILTDKALLVGSANISKNSRNNLDEVAIFTTDPVTMQRSTDFIEQICIEPVLPKYLEECKRNYKSPPPNSPGNPPPTHHAKLWIVSLVIASIPSAELKKFDKSVEKAEKRINLEVSTVDTFHWPYKTKMADELKTEDWVIQCVKQDDNSILVCPPCRLIADVDHYTRDEKTGKERYIFHLERKKGSQNMKWPAFQKTLKTVIGKSLKKPRNMPIRDIKQADDLLRLWTDKGRVRKSK